MFRSFSKNGKYRGMRGLWYVVYVTMADDLPGLQNAEN